jgi:hypothetical protein
MVAILAVVSGIRFNVGTDFKIQIDYYNWTVLGLTDSFLEVGFRYYILFINYLFGDIRFFFFFASVFVVFTFGYSISKNVDKKYRFLVLGLFITTTIYFASMNAFRQYISISFLLIGFEHLKKRHFIPYLTTILLACLFHQSAIVLIPFSLFFWWFTNNKGSPTTKYKLLNTLLIYSLALGLLEIIFEYRYALTGLASIFLPSKYDGYFYSIYFSNKKYDSIFKIIVPNCIWFFLYYKNKLISNRRSTLYTYIPSFFSYLVINNLLFGINVSIRIGWYFEPVILYIIPIIFECQILKRNKLLFKLGIMIYFFALTLVSIFILGGHSVVPYHSFL